MRLCRISLLSHLKKKKKGITALCKISKDCQDLKKKLKAMLVAVHFFFFFLALIMRTGANK